MTRASLRGAGHEGGVHDDGLPDEAAHRLAVRAPARVTRLVLAGLLAGLLAGCGVTAARRSEPSVGVASVGAPLQIAPLPAGSAEPQPVQRGPSPEPQTTGSIAGATSPPALAAPRAAPALDPGLAPGVVQDDASRLDDAAGPVSADCQRGDAAYWQGCADLKGSPKLIPGRYTRSGEFVPSDRRR